MVKLTKIEDEEVPVVPTDEQQQAAVPETKEEQEAVKAVVTEEEEDDDEEESEEESDDEDDDDYDENETLLERLEALKDILTPDQRTYIQNTASKTKRTFQNLLSKCGNGLWMLSTSMLLLGVPLALSIVNETQLMELEKEMQLQQSSNELLAPGSENAFQQQGTGVASQ